MKQAKAVRRTFPAGGGGEEFEVTRQVSAMDKTVYDSRKGAGAPPAATPSYSASNSSSFGSSSFGGSSFGSSSFGSSSFGSASSTFGGTPEPAAPAAESAPAAAAPAEEATPQAEFKPSRATNVDTSMDMFRNMAKKVGR
ncbi:MAG: hypothetical protein HC805_06205 [Alkalinema sp. RL_2_19]|nr:hypothetical protein [Alkalinema sp. RL_2_19]